MLALPGLNLSALPVEPTALASASAATRTQDLAANTEYRFEVPFTRSLTIKLLSGTAELFGTELGPSNTYAFKGTKGAIYTWHGCRLEVGGEAESEYVAEETTMMSTANAHFALEGVRDAAVQEGDAGPRVLVVGPENSGKTSLVRILTGYAVKCGRQPVVVNLDPRQGMLSVPGSFSAAAFSSIVDVEEGWGSSPISGPSPIPVKMPLVYHYGMGNPEAEDGRVFRPLVTRMALAVTSRLEEDTASKQAGLIIDSPGSMAQGKNGSYENIEHIVSEFSVNVLFVLGSERLYSDLSRRLSNLPPSESCHVIRLDKSGGCVDRTEDYMKALRQSQIRSYFFGASWDNPLAPQSHMAEFDDLNIYKVNDTSEAANNNNNSFQPGDADESVYGKAGGSDIFEKVVPSSYMTNSLLAITTAAGNDRQEAIRDASVRGYIYVADVDETKKKIRVLSPQPGLTPTNAIILGSFPEDVPSLVG